MRGLIMALSLCLALAAVPKMADSKDCAFPGKGIGVGSKCDDGGGPTVSASEPLTLALTAAALFGASLLRRRRPAGPPRDR
jgi:hypothetical protein